MYKNIITLGFNCAIARSCRKFGLRSRDYPFDWGVSNLEGVIEAIESGFSEFMERKWMIETNDKCYYQTKYKYYFAHDFEDGLWNETDFEGQFSFVKQKYQKKIAHLIEDCKDSALFIRQIENMEEAKYIVWNLKHIQEVLQICEGSGNQIIWIGEKDVAEYLSKRNIFCYEAEIDWMDGSTGWLLNRNTELKNFLLENQIDSRKQVKNLLYVEELYEARIQKEMIDGRIKEKLLKVFLNAEKKKELENIFKNKNFVIYGAGKLGALLGETLASMEIYPIYYLDKFKKKAGLQLNERKLVTILQSKDMAKPEYIVVAIPYEGESLSEVKSRLKQNYHCVVADLESLLDGVL